MRKNKFWQLAGTFLLFLFNAINPAFSQSVTGKLTIADTLVDVGRPFRIEMEVSHPSDIVVIFPDSASEFEPFEWVDTHLETTVTTEGISVDKAVYRLYTWKIDAQQEIKLPFRFVRNRDTISSFTNATQFKVRELIAEMNDSLKVKSAEGFYEIEPPTNWRAILTISLILIFFIVGAVFVFSKPIGNFFIRRRIERDWRKTLSQLESLINQTENQSDFIIRLNHTWKKYIDRNHKIALLSLSTTELMQALKEIPYFESNEKNSLFTSSKAADRIIFAQSNVQENELKSLLSEIKTVLEKEYRRRKEVLET